MVALHLNMNYSCNKLFFCYAPNPTKHPKTTKLNLNTPWMKQNYYKKKTLIIIFSYLPWIILNSWKFNTTINFIFWFALVDSRSQFLTSHAIFNHCAHVERTDQIIFCKSLSFSIHDITSHGTLPMPQTLRFNICNNYFEVNLTKVGFGNGGRCSTIIISLSHLH
jgi:hypothetical protein